MAFEAVGDVVIRKLTDLLIHDSIAFGNVIDRIEEIRIELRHMRGFLTDAELSHSPDVVEWAKDYLRALFSAEDEIEKYILSLAARGTRNIDFFQRHGFTLFAAVYDSFGPCRSLRRKLRNRENEIEKLKVQKDGLQKKRSDSAPATAVESRSSDASASLSPLETWRLKSRNTFPSSHSLNFRLGHIGSASPRGGYRKHPKPPNSGPDLEDIGLNEDRTHLVQRLKEEIGVIPVVGAAGSGKTTLVRTVYDLLEIKERFDCRAWVHVPGEYMTASQILDSLLQKVHESKDSGNPTTAQLIDRVSDSLKDKRYLVVLDHVSKARDWMELKSAFPDLDSGVNKVILITRDQGVVEEHCTVCTPHHLAKLSEEDSWELLTKKACSYQCKPNDGLKEEILDKCKGHPLDIVLLGGFLSTKGPNCDEWRWHLDQANWQEVEMDILQLSYNDLAGHAKLCLLYMTLFPSEVDISVRRLHRLWLAEGFIRRSPGMSEEDTVERCFNDLVQRNLIKISKFKSDGSSKRCYLPRAVHGHLSPKAHQISLFYYHQDSVSIPPKLGARRVVDCVDVHAVNDSANSLLSYENVRSYLSFNFQRNDTPAKEVSNFISKIIGNKGYGVLRVLDLEGVYKPTLPETLKHLFHLRYLGLRWTFLDKLPKSVGDLPYLETLDLKRTYITSLPSSIWKLKLLRHLNLPGICLDYKRKKGHDSLPELRTLVGLIVNDGSAVKELDKLRELRELGVTCQLSYSEDLKNLSMWIQKLTNLKFLGLKSKDTMGRPSTINLPPLPKLAELSHVSLLGSIKELPDANLFPPNLKVLALSVSCLKKDPMTTLSRLPSLSVLRLLAKSYLGTRMECPKDGFKQLLVLKLWMLDELKDWEVKEGGMPHLKKLNIRKCCNLEQLPSQLLKQASLEELTLTSMPKKFVDGVKPKKQGHTILIEDSYNFTPLPVSGKRIRNFGTALRRIDINLDDA